MKKRNLLILSTAFLAACSGGSGEKTEKTETVTKAIKGVNLDEMDKTIDPCHNFFDYSAGSWVKNNPVPSTEGKWTAFNIVADRNNEILREILEKSAAITDAEKGSNTQKIGDFYATVMDSTARNIAGITPIQAELDQISALKDIKGLYTIVANQHLKGIGSIFSFGIEQDLKNNEVHAAYISQVGTSLPDRDYYFKDDASSVEIRSLFTTHVDNLMGKAKLEGSFSKSVMNIETGLAEASMNRTELRDYEKQYNKMSIEDFKALAPSFDWDGYYATLGVSFDTIIVSQPEFLKQFETMLTSVSLNEWKEYLTWNVLTTTASKLSDELEQENFAFFGTALGGQKEMQPRWKRSLKSANRYLGETVGKEFVKVAFSEDSKKRVNDMLDNIMLVLEERIKGLEWMGEETKKEALKKLNSFGRKLGYPDVWQDYSNLEIKRDSYAQNYFRVMKFETRKNLNKLGNPIDKTEWGMPPQMVNAYYHPLLNEVAFPAGILQPPFMDPEADDAVLYATIGAVIGHEITHGFDDSGARFNSEGEMKSWWTDEDMANFKTRGQKIVEHFNKFEALDSLFVNGELTLGENIADFGGLTIAYYAYQKSVEGKERVDIDGFNPEQRFFIAYGQVWKGNYTEEALRQQVLTNPHSPNKFRVIGTLSMMPEFYAAFGCKPGSDMHTTDSLRAVIW
jgi:putative endopeptidase